MQQVQPAPGIEAAQLLRLAGALETKSTHPIAKAVVDYVGEALADVGIMMGGLGSDATIEAADVVIHTDHPSKIATARRIARATHIILWQNIWLDFAVTAIVSALGAGGLTTTWEAVFANVRVALLAILNAVRIQRMKF